MESRDGELTLVGPTPPEVDVDIILVPGLGTTSASDWAIVQSQWKKIIDSTRSRVRFLAYRCSADVRDGFDIDFFLQEGSKLLDCLSRHQKAQDKPLPTLFMSHSLGSFVTKQALCIANARTHQYAAVLHSIIGIVWLGGPHPVGLAPETATEKLLLLLRSFTATSSKQVIARIKDQLSILVDISRLYDDIQLNVDVLTMYESAPTKVKVSRREGGSFLSGTQSVILVDQSLAATKSLKEQCCPLHGNHQNLIRLEQADGYPQENFKKWLTFILSRDNRDACLRRMETAIMSDSPTASFTSIASAEAAKAALTSAESMPPAKDPNSHVVTAGSSLSKEWELLPILNGLSMTRRRAKLPCFMMDTLVRNHDFEGREDVFEKLDSWLLSQDAGSRSFSSQADVQRHVVLCGMGGIGKTSIAMHFAFTRRDKFDAVFWVRADEPAKLQRDFANIAICLDLLDHSEASNPVVCRELAMGWLSDPKKVLDETSDLVGQSEAKWLLIFDNADSPETLQDYWPLSQSGSILVTSRDPLAKSSPSIASHSLDVPPMEAAEAATLLRNLCGRTSGKDDSRALEIALKLDGLPLAISQMAAIIKHQFWSFSEFLERYQNYSDRKDLQAFEQEGSRRSEARGNVASIWAIEELSKGARTLLQLFALLDPDCIQESMFKQPPAEVEALDGYPTHWLDYAKYRAELLKKSLVTSNADAEEFWIHRIVQDSVKAHMSDQRSETVFSVTVSILAKAWGTTSLENRYNWQRSQKRASLFPHLMSLKSVYTSNIAGRHRDSAVALARLMDEGGWWLHERGASQHSKEFWGVVNEICTRFNLPITDNLPSDVHYGLGAAASKTNDVDACLKHTQELLRLRAQAFEVTHKADIRLAIAYNERGLALTMSGDFEQAITLYKRSIEIYQSLPEYWPSMDTNPRTNMSFTLWITGDLEIASATLEQLLKDREFKFGPDDTESYRTGRVLHCLGNVRYSQGRLDESQRLHRKALSRYQLILGNRHQKTADLCHRVAQHCIRNGDFDSARTLINEALQVWRPEGSTYLPEIARTTFLKAKLEMMAGSPDDATRLFKEARDLRNGLPRSPRKHDKDLTEEDFDALVTFWSR